MLGTRKSPQVLIAGGGPVGLLAAAKLARQRIPATVIDSQWTPATRSYALALHARSLEILEELDLLKPLLEEGHLLRSVGFYDASGRQAEIALQLLDRPVPGILVVGQAALERVLVDDLAKSKTSRVLWSHRLRRFDLEEGAVRATVDKLGKDSSGYGTATTGWVIDKTLDWTPRFLIGADGHASAVRRCLELEFDAAGSSETFGVFECRGPGAGEDTELKIVLTDEGTNVLWPMGGDRCRWSFQIRDEAPARHGKERLYVQLAGSTYPHLDDTRLNELLAERARWWDVPIESVDWAASLDFDRRLAASFAQGPVALLGDAAHLAGPVSVRSMNAGLEEAVELTQFLAGVLENGDDDLGIWGAGRRKPWTQWITMSPDDIGAEDPASPWVRDHRAAICDALPALGADLDVLLGQLGLRRSSRG